MKSEANWMYISHIFSYTENNGENLLQKHGFYVSYDS